ncbi:hypothetical protein EDB84DRAFT_1445595 [Lactarius hengduanensis]|nr:hypothetical protein EDB84DRAFT_1445595 [Lactarius hengduanensis]
MPYAETKPTSYSRAQALFWRRHGRARSLLAVVGRVTMVDASPLQRLRSQPQAILAPCAAGKRARRLHFCRRSTRRRASSSPASLPSARPPRLSRMRTCAARFSCSRLARLVVSMRTSSSDDPTQPGTRPGPRPPCHYRGTPPMQDRVYAVRQTTVMPVWMRRPIRGDDRDHVRDHVNSEAMTKVTAMTKDQGSDCNDDADGLAAKT